MVVIGIILILLGLFLGFGLLLWLGVALAIIGAVLWATGNRLY